MHGLDAELSQNNEKLLFQILESPKSDQKITLNEKPHVWCASFSNFTRNINAFRTILSLEENFRANGFIHRSDREQAVIARGLLRTLLAKYLNVMPVDLEFTYDQFGKPILSTDKHKAAPVFNVSHSGDFFLLAVATTDSIIGIDVEQHRNIPELLHIADKYFHVNEMKELAMLTLPVRAVAFFDCWTRKESIAKALGLGISMPLRDFSVSLLPGVPPKLLFWLLREGEVRHWSLRALQLPKAGYSATVASREISLHEAHYWHYINP